MNFNPIDQFVFATFNFSSFAQYLNSNEENTVIKGSPLYMAPEILLKHSYNPSADLWSIGVILYECIYGAAPYSSKTLDELLHKIKVKQKIIIDTTKVSSECRDLMIRLLKHEPHERITFEEFFVHPFLNSKHNLSDEVCFSFTFMDLVIFLFYIFSLNGSFLLQFTESGKSDTNCNTCRRRR